MPVGSNYSHSNSSGGLSGLLMWELEIHSVMFTRSASVQVFSEGATFQEVGLC